MPTSIIPLNVSQKIQEIPVLARVVVHPHTYYTCPTGKKAIVKGSAVCEATGAATSVALIAGGVTICTWSNASVSPTDDNHVVNRPREVPLLFEVELTAGQILQTTQNAGVNAEFTINAKALELPA